MLRLIILAFFVTTAYTSPTIDELEERNKVAVSTPEGEEYEMNAVMAFWGNPHFMMECLPSGSSAHYLFTILFEVIEN